MSIGRAFVTLDLGQAALDRNPDYYGYFQVPRDEQRRARFGPCLSQCASAYNPFSPRPPAVGHCSSLDIAARYRKEQRCRKQRDQTLTSSMYCIFLFIPACVTRSMSKFIQTRQILAELATRLSLQILSLLKSTRLS